MRRILLVCVGIAVISGFDGTAAIELIAVEEVMARVTECDIPLELFSSS